VKIVGARIGLEVCQDTVRIGGGEIGQYGDVVAVALDDVAALGRHDDGAVEAALFLCSGVGVIPVGPALFDREMIGKGLPRRDARKAVETRHAVHVAGEDEAMPMDRGQLVQRVLDMQGDVFPFGEAQGRAGELPVDGKRSVAISVDRHRRARNDQRIVARERGAAVAKQKQSQNGANENHSVRSP